ncbi:MAG: CvpA family protein, partial [Bacilli bacterium]|nr:CvpA family protein [Bacilli bacterium]
MKHKIMPIIITIILGALLYYFMLPPLNLNAPLFWAFALTIFVIYFISSEIYKLKTNENIITKIEKTVTRTSYLLLIVPGVIAFILLINVINTPLFNSNKYYNRIIIKEDGVFEEDVNEVDFKALPLLDKDSSQKLGDRVMGQMTELVSQFRVSDLYTQINYKSDIVRVTPLEYANVIKYFTNRKGGVKGYIILNSVTGKAELVKLDKGMKYMPSALFNENLHRKLRFSFPFENFGTEKFELDNDGNPFWIIPTIKYVGVGLRPEVTGVVTLNPITGETKKYSTEEVPTWIDHVHQPSLLLEQVDDWGKYASGYFNSVFGQKGVIATTQGYNYTVMNDDVYLYTGITSVASDESNIGFILSNLRTKETVFYPVSGAEEYSAMASAEGQVQQMKYRATFPLLINLNNKPTYLLSLKDNAGLVKMYAFVDVVDYQKVVVSDAKDGIEAAALSYLGNDER